MKSLNFSGFEIESKNHKKQFMLGIVGGLGSETSCNFCLKINNRVRKILKIQPDIMMENLPIPVEVEKRVINGGDASEMLVFLENSIKRLNKLDVDLIVIPCNTVHIFLDKLRKISKSFIMSIVEECAKKCNSLGFKKVGILASETTVKEHLHQKELSKLGIKLILPERNEQSEINNVILNILNNKQEIKEKEILLQIINSLKEAGAEAIILGCTDFQIIVPDNESCLPVIDTLLVLEDSTVDILTKNHTQPTENN